MIKETTGNKKETYQLIWRDDNNMIKYEPEGNTCNATFGICDWTMSSFSGQLQFTLKFHIEKQ